MLVPILCFLLALPSPADQLVGALETYEVITSNHIRSRQVDVWLPANYDTTGETRYQVLYMHDGQNLFSPHTAYGGEEWAMDETVTRLMEVGTLPPTIVVGIWNTTDRHFEYTPEKIFARMPEEDQKRLREEFSDLRSPDHTQSLPNSDAYLRFLVTELKPFIDSVYHTNSKREVTFIMGSSMGGLISFYAAFEYPDVFAGAGCISTHWPLSLADNDFTFTGAAQDYLINKFPLNSPPRIYMDYGTTTLDSWYEPHQQRINAIFIALQYPIFRWTSRKFEGAAHNESSWRKRVEIPLQFLMGH